MADHPAPAFETRLEQLDAAGRQVRDTYEAWQTALVERDQLVDQSLTEGIPQRAIAARLGISQQRVGRLTLPRGDRT